MTDLDELNEAFQSLEVLLYDEGLDGDYEAVLLETIRKGLRAYADILPKLRELKEQVRATEEVGYGASREKMIDSYKELYETAARIASELEV